MVSAYAGFSKNYVVDQTQRIIVQYIDLAKPKSGASIFWLALHLGPQYDNFIQVSRYLVLTAVSDHEMDLP